MRPSWLDGFKRPQDGGARSAGAREDALDLGIRVDALVPRGDAPGRGRFRRVEAELAAERGELGVRTSADHRERGPADPEASLHRNGLAPHGELGVLLDREALMASGDDSWTFCRTRSRHASRRFLVSGIVAAHHEPRADEGTSAICEAILGYLLLQITKELLGVAVDRRVGAAEPADCDERGVGRPVGRAEGDSR